MSEWQPIETAPKDGTWIVVVSWHNPYYCGAVQWVNGQWWRDNDRPDDLFDNVATHWVAVPDFSVAAPAPPEADKSE